jgi:hypothetical protein
MNNFKKAYIFYITTRPCFEVSPEAFYCCISTCTSFVKFFTLWNHRLHPAYGGTVLQGIRGTLLQLHALRLAAAAKSAIAEFRYNKSQAICSMTCKKRVHYHP